jgi:hypothetical protein
MHGSDRVPDLNDYEASLGWHGTFSARAKWRSSPSACRSVLKNCLTPPTLSETRFFANNVENGVSRDRRDTGKPSCRVLVSEMLAHRGLQGPHRYAAVSQKFA